MRFVGGQLQLFGINLPLLPIFNISRGNEGATGWLVPDIQRFEQEGLRDRRALSLADRAQPRRDADAARLHRRPSRRSKRKYRQLDSMGRVPGRRLPDLRDDRKRRPRRRPRPARASAAISRPTASPSSTRCGASPARSASRATRPSPAATTSPTTTACATSSTPSGSPPIPTSRSPAGRSKACASTTCRSKSRSRFRRSTRASGWRTSLGGNAATPGQQPVDHSDRGTGYAAGFRQRRVGSAAADAVGPGS